MDHLIRWSEPIDTESAIRCGLCPHHCTLRPGQTGRCGVRRCVETDTGPLMEISTGERISSLCADPIEKKPLFHFYPGEQILSVGRTGCNLRCSFCQNWRISRISSEECRESQCGSRSTLTRSCTVEQIVRIATESGYRHVALTYNEPVVHAEYGMAIAHACRERGVHTVAVTNGYIETPARQEFFRDIAAANVDLKSIHDEFYRQYCGATLAPVLETLRYLAHETEIWLEVTNLIIPDANDTPEELSQLATWIAENLGPEVPLHFSAFHPTYHLTDRPPTPPETLELAY
ncbi:MAG: AmmeMemoRadiSam system radical SAM enzyme, partial [Planctomycetia bacterium]|nr:AmmeMemoRadiSam system radical SAM enzyme [Planctomycetia bacterium]